MKKNILALGVTSTLLGYSLTTTNIVFADSLETSEVQESLNTSELNNYSDVSLDVSIYADTLNDIDKIAINKIMIKQTGEYSFDLVYPTTDKFSLSIEEQDNFKIVKNSFENNWIFSIDGLKPIPSILFSFKSLETNLHYDINANIEMNVETGLIENFTIKSLNTRELSALEQNYSVMNDGVVESDSAEVLSPEYVSEPSESNSDEKTSGNESFLSATEESAMSLTEITDPDNGVAVEETLDTDSVELNVTEAVPEIKSFSTTSASPIPVTADGLYTVKSGDTFYSIAKSFNLSVLQLQAYNSQLTDISKIDLGSSLAVTRQAVENNLSDEEKTHLYTGNVSSNFPSQTAFFDYLYPHAKQLAAAPGEKELYVSIMLAQAALESGYGNSALASPPFHNLTGIKNNGNDNYVKMWTREEVESGEEYYVLADFKVFDTYYDALKGNADIIRYRGYYEDVWVENSTNYSDAVVALDKSPYASDTMYGTKIMSIINKYELYKYDFDTMQNTNDVNYYGIINSANSGIYTLPKNVNGALLVTSYLFNGQNVKITQETTTESGVFAKIVKADNDKLLGWIKKSDLALYDSVQSEKVVSYFGSVQPNNGGIFSRPKGTYNSLLRTSYLYNEKSYRATEEAITKDGTYVRLYSADSSKEIGWINKNALNIYDAKEVDYFAKVKSNNNGIYTAPKPISGSALFTKYLYNGKSFLATEQVIIDNITYVKIVRPTDGGFVGWIQREDLEEYSSIQSKISQQSYGVVKAGNEGIYTSPKGLYNSVLVTSYVYNDKGVKITEKASTQDGIFYKLNSLKDSSVIGWINVKDITASNYILSSKSVAYDGIVNPLNDGIYTQPMGSYGALLVTSYLYNNKEIKVIEEVMTLNGIFLKIVDKNTGITIGWIKKDNVKMVPSFSTVTKVDYNAWILDGNDGIYTLPKGTEGSQLVTSYFYNDQKLKVSEEISVSGVVYVKLNQLSDGKVIGWIKKEDVQISYAIFLDAGHGGYESGATYSGIQEKTLNLEVAFKVKAYLEKLGMTVIMSRSYDEYVSLLNRSIDVNGTESQIFVSIHHNAMPGSTTVNGIETYYYEYDEDYPSRINEDMHNDPTRILESAKLAAAIHENLIDSTGAADRGIRSETFSVLRETAVPAVLLELGYMSSSTELSKLTNTDYQITMAKAISNGIATYFK